MPMCNAIGQKLSASAATRCTHATRIHDRITFDVSASIIPFAQGEMVDTFIAGGDPS